MNFRNLAENLIIVLVSVLAGGVTGYTASQVSNKQAIELLRPTIEQAIQKETTAISNEFKTEIRKLKGKKDSEVKLILTPDVQSTLDVANENQKEQEQIPKKKEGFFKRLFKRSD